MVTDLDLAAGELCFYRAKVNKTQFHKLSTDTLPRVDIFRLQEVGG